jgi:hypothetical protein
MRIEGHKVLGVSDFDFNPAGPMADPYSSGRLIETSYVSSLAPALPGAGQYM